MGLSAFVIAGLTAASVGASFLQKNQEDKSAQAAFEAETDELVRQRFEADQEAARDASELALEMDKLAARAEVAMETLGGAGTVNDERAQAEIAGVKAVDITRIESNRSSKAQALSSRQRASFARAEARSTRASARFLQDSLRSAGTAFSFAVRQKGQSAQRERARGNL